MGVVCVHSTRPSKVTKPKYLARILPTFVVLAFAISITVFLIWNNRVETISLANHDPRLSYSGPFQNIHPSVQYVGDHSCIGCHDEHIESFAKHPMGQALATMADATTIEKYDIAAKNPFVANGFRYQISSPADGAQHQEDLEFMEGPSNSIGKSKGPQLPDGIGWLPLPISMHLVQTRSPLGLIPQFRGKKPAL